MANPINDVLAGVMVAFAALGLLAVAALARDSGTMALREQVLAGLAALFVLAMGAAALP